MNVTCGIEAACKKLEKCFPKLMVICCSISTKRREVVEIAAFFVTLQEVTIHGTLQFWECTFFSCGKLS